MPADAFTLTDFVACFSQLHERTKSADFRKDLYDQGASSELLGAFRPERIEAEIKSMKAAIGSMTIDESTDPDKICDSRRARIASGSGVSVDTVHELLRQFSQMSKMCKSLSALRTQR
jgi:signal recognition particle GTPase